MKRKILLLISLIVVLGNTNGQTNFTVTNGTLNWKTTLGISSGSVVKYSENADAAIYSEFGMKMFTLQQKGAEWKGHLINGEVTTDFQDFQYKLSVYGFGSNNKYPSIPFYQYMDTNGDGTGNINMAVDGSVDSVIYLIKPDSGRIIYIARIISNIRDSGTFDAGGWGNNGGSPLAVGLELIWKTNGIYISLTENYIKSHYDLATISYDISHNSWGQGDEFVTSRFTFTKAGQYIPLNGTNGDEFILIIRDDLSYLIDQRISVQGYYFKY